MVHHYGSRVSAIVVSALLAGGLVVASPAQAESGAVIVKVGSLTLSNPESGYNFDTGSTYAFGGDLELRFETGTALGAELVVYAHDYLGGAGTLTTTAFMFNAKKYFKVHNNVYPFVGAGLGFSGGSLSGVGSGSGSGFAVQAMGGAELRFDRVGVYVEYKLLSSKIEDDVGTSIDVSAKGLMAGVSVAF